MHIEREERVDLRFVAQFCTGFIRVAVEVPLRFLRQLICKRRIGLAWKAALDEIEAS